MDYGLFNVHTDVTACNCALGCTDTVRESALQVDLEKKIPCRTGESNLRRRRAGSTLYQLSYIPIPHCTYMRDSTYNCVITVLTLPSHSSHYFLTTLPLSTFAVSSFRVLVCEERRHRNQRKPPFSRQVVPLPRCDQSVMSSFVASWTVNRVAWWTV